MYNTTIQWITDYTRYREEDKPSRLDLLFTKRINLEKDINYECPFGRNDHVVLEIDIKGNMDENRRNHIKRKEGVIQNLSILY